MGEKLTAKEINETVEEMRKVFCVESDSDTKKEAEHFQEKVKSKIPIQLQKEGFGFVKLKQRSKTPFERRWQDNPYSYRDIQPWIDEGCNYGVLGGYGDLIIIDADTPELSQLIKDKLPSTFTIKSPKKGYHYYYFCKDIKKKIVLTKDTPGKKDDHFGEIVTKGSQVVAPGSIHPDTGTAYEVYKDLEIAEVSRELIFSELVEYIPIEFPQKDAETEIKNINIVDVLNKKEIQLHRVGSQLVCGHPVHGSTNNSNFVVHPEKNVWHCFRCQTGGGALSLIAVLEGVIQCHEAAAGGLRGYKFTKTLQLAKDIYGFDVKAKPLSQAETILSEDGIASLGARIKAIPTDTAPVKIPVLLDPILKEIAGFNNAQGDALLKHTIKEHFGFTNDDLKSYEKVLKGYRKEPKDDDARKSLSKAELIEKLHDEQGNMTIHPAQDYTDGMMVFTVKVKDIPCLITSDRRLFALTDASQEGFVIKHDTVDTARFSAKGVTAFLDGKYGVSITTLYEKIYGYVRRFVHFTDELYLSFITLWVMGSYLFMIFRYYPYVWLNAEKASGKTLLMEVLSEIAFNGELITNPTESVIFRDISNNLTTMFIDEVEQLRKRDRDTYGSLISLLNAGFNKAGVVKRVESTGQGGFVVKPYSAYSPKMFAGISEIDDVLQDRTVRIPLLRKKDDETTHRYKGTPEILKLQQSIRDDLYVFALTHGKDLAEFYHKEGSDAIKGLSHLNNRELDIWEPLFLLANVIDSQAENTKLTDIMEALSKKSVEEKQSDNVSQNETYKLLNVVKVMIDELSAIQTDGNIKVFDAQAVLNYFKANEDFDWIQKTNVLTRRLKKVNVRSEQRRISGEKKRAYVMDTTEFQDLCERFKI
ncbi:MAG: DNA primase-like protein [Candidatus Saganbacteria bacterium]|uniref:DNA primase-like protein n=1 Tax=Candidatus Saganbacteria bacterium TaxID=2575572 RepID=A0A833L0V2_UNCSA|nr:MAG: DNA primase-like protein [Candidatus Saganbacteria bacterium]